MRNVKIMSKQPKIVRIEETKLKYTEVVTILLKSDSLMQVLLASVSKPPFILIAGACDRKKGVTQ
jgi:hypothetical protein